MYHDSEQDTNSSKNNIMKRLIFLLAFAIGFTSLFAQPLPEPTETGPDTLQGLDGTLTVYSPPMDGYWDYSAQLKSTFSGVGDSTHFSVTVWQSNDRDQSTWTEITAERDTLATVTDDASILSEQTDFTGLWVKWIFTSASLDTMLIETYQVKKKFKLF